MVSPSNPIQEYSLLAKKSRPRAAKIYSLLYKILCSWFLSWRLICGLPENRRKSNASGGGNSPEFICLRHRGFGRVSAGCRARDRIGPKGNRRWLAIPYFAYFSHYLPDDADCTFHIDRILNWSVNLVENLAFQLWPWRHFLKKSEEIGFSGNNVTIAFTGVFRRWAFPNFRPNGTD